MRPAWMARELRCEEQVVSVGKEETSDSARDRSTRLVKPVSRASIFPTSPSRFFVHASCIFTGGTASLSFGAKSRSRSAISTWVNLDITSEIRRIRTTYIVLLECIIVTTLLALCSRNGNIDGGQHLVHSNEIKRKLANYLVLKRLTPLGLSGTWTAYK